jgi:predicted CXXCH cytochrome family protein
MKKILLLTTMFVAFATMSFGQEITGSPHDFSAANTPEFNPMPGEICAPCHQPHNGTNTAGNILWSGTLNADPGTNYTMYTSGTLSGTAEASGSSLMCLSCHDQSTTPHTNFVYDDVAADEGNTGLGTSLIGTHPIGVASRTGEAGFQAVAPTVARYVAGVVECGSCHNPHDNTTNTNFLIGSNVGSALCLDCHDK